MKNWRTSSWIYLVLVAGAIAAEVIYATTGEEALQGNALTLLLFLTIIFAIYRGLTRNRNSRPCPRCGKPVPNGILYCLACDFSFSSIGEAQDAQTD